ncbi:MAG: hypothetical protein LBH79_00220 [Nitrososphaerota archaeon]|jgi:hypothetical protein|nr:hypothetical protein [Nitrososphaerota archaeon]
MKIRILTFSSERIVEFLQGKPCSFASSLPDDLELLDMKMDLLNRQITLIVRSDSFEDIAEGLPFPEINPTTTTTTTKVAPKPVAVKTVDLVQRIGPKPASASFQSVSLTPAPTQPSLSRYASKMENEFSADQRKLLSFTVKEDCVVVKPVVFLKTEWDDINETVRSLGGRWVKGAIISYWEIPLQ